MVGSASRNSLLLVLALLACQGDRDHELAEGGLGDVREPADGATADASACRQATVYVDADGDGRGAGAAQLHAPCEPAVLSPGLSELGSDCDDRDPKVWQWTCADRDGDRAPVFVCTGAEPDEHTVPCGVIVERVPGYGQHDCDDSDSAAIDI